MQNTEICLEKLLDKIIIFLCLYLRHSLAIDTVRIMVYNVVQIVNTHWITFKSFLVLFGFFI